MSINEFIAKLNKTFTDINKDFNYLRDKLPELLQNELMIPDDLLDLEISLSDLNVNLQLTCLKVSEYEHVLTNNLNDNKKNEENKKNNLNDKKNEDYDKFENNIGNNLIDDLNKEINENGLLVNQTMKKFLPMMMMHMMLIDKNSILNSKTFCNKNNNYNNYNKNTSGDSFNLKDSPEDIILPEIELD
jgi:hypothetical protein